MKDTHVDLWDSNFTLDSSSKQDDARKMSLLSVKFCELKDIEIRISNLEEGSPR